MRDLTNHLRARLARLMRQQSDDEPRPIDWDALARPGGWSDFVASTGPPPPEVVELKRAHRERLARACADLNCTPADLGFLDDAAVERVRNGQPVPGPPLSGFVDLPAPDPRPSGTQLSIVPSHEGEFTDEHAS